MLTNSMVFAIVGIYAALFALALTLCAGPLYGILQQEGYSGGASLKWYFRKKNMLRRRYRLLALCVLLITALLSLSFSFLGANYAEIFAAAGFLALCGIFLYAFRRALKVPLKHTRRAVRLIVCTYILLFAALYGAGIGLYCAAEAIGHDLARVLRMTPVCIFPALLFLFPAAANCIMKLYEVPRSRALVRRAKRTLAASPCVKVGITGSFGKTSVKHIAEQILSSKFRVKATPASFNTPIGIAKFVNGEGCDCDIFLAEMGARHMGEIGELCRLVDPTVGVVTGVCGQHLSGFGSLENIRKEKGELARHAKTVILGKTAHGMREDALLEGKDFSADEVELFPDRTVFTLRLGEHSAKIETKLLGRHAAEDIALAGALCLALGMAAEDIFAAVPAVTPVPHRLERSESGGIVILDDSYNSNTEGAKNAVEILRMCPGKRVIVTPGLVELGEAEETENFALGKEMAGVDAVVLVGETRVLDVRKGFVEGGGQEEQLSIVPDLKAAQILLSEILHRGDSVLFLNDLPDKY